MKFPKEILKELVYEDHDPEEFELIEKKMIGQRRWTTEYSMIFKDIKNEKFYEVEYESGSTENCDTRPFDYGPDMVECQEVVPVEETVIVYKPAISGN